MNLLRDVVREINYKLLEDNNLEIIDLEGRYIIKLQDIVLWDSDKEHLDSINGITEKDHYKIMLIRKIETILLYLKIAKDGIFNSMNNYY